VSSSLRRMARTETIKTSCETLRQTPLKWNF
jgi:hypothetical protein